VHPPQIRGPGTILDYYQRPPASDRTRFRSELPDQIASIYRDLAGAFGTRSTSPDQAMQREIAHQFLGADNVLPKDELRAVLHAAQRADLFDRHPPPGSPRSPVTARNLRRARGLARRIGHQLSRAVGR
jgi:hypothetical protein